MTAPITVNVDAAMAQAIADALRPQLALVDVPVSTRATPADTLLLPQPTVEVGP